MCLILEGDLLPGLSFHDCRDFSGAGRNRLMIGQHYRDIGPAHLGEQVLDREIIR